jgi:hypothetical protein
MKRKVKSVDVKIGRVFIEKESAFVFGNVAPLALQTPVVNK